MNDFLSQVKKNTHNKKTSNLLRLVAYIVPSVVLLVVFSGLVFSKEEMGEYISQNKVLEMPIVSSVAAYPLISQQVLGISSSSLNSNLTDITADAYMIVDFDSLVPLAQKNEDFRFSMASTTKLMTAQVALDHYKLDDILTIQSEGVEGAKVGFRKGQQFYFKDLLYAMLLPSGNDASIAIAQNYPGGVPKFVEAMNQKAKFLNLDNTHFSDPAGLEDQGDYTTAKELILLTSFALKNPVIAEIVGTYQKEISSLGNTRYNLENLNKLLGYKQVNGIKTGYTQEAGEVLVTSQKIGEDHTLLFVVMKSKDRFGDTKKLIDSLVGKIEYKTF